MFGMGPYLIVVGHSCYFGYCVIGRVDIITRTNLYAIIVTRQRLAARNRR